MSTHTDDRKTAILDALDAFVRQRPGLEFGNYGDVTSYRSELRSITRDLHDYRELRKAVAWRDGITADALLEAARSAYSGRLTLIPPGPHDHGGGHFSSSPQWRVDYCTGQYFPTEYRRAACAVLAQALCYYTREHAMPESGSDNYREEVSYNTRGQIVPPAVANREKEYRMRGKWMSAGDWLRAYMRKEFGRGLAARWFN